MKVAIQVFRIFFTALGWLESFLWFLNFIDESALSTVFSQMTVNRMISIGISAIFAGVAGYLIWLILGLIPKFIYGMLSAIKEWVELGRRKRRWPAYQHLDECDYCGGRVEFLRHEEGRRQGEKWFDEKEMRQSKALNPRTYAAENRVRAWVTTWSCVKCLMRFWLFKDQNGDTHNCSEEPKVFW